MQAIDLWKQRLTALTNSFRVAEASLGNENAYVYRIALTFYDAALISAIIDPESDWKPNLEKALAAMQQSANSDDCQKRSNYPFNLAGMLIEMNFGQWLEGETPDHTLVSRAINLYVEGVYKERKQPLGVMSVLPFSYLLRKDAEHLAAFWNLLGSKTDLQNLPPELKFWWKVSTLFLENDLQGLTKFLLAYQAYYKTFKTPLEQPMRFYAGVAMLATILFGMNKPPVEALRCFALNACQE